MFVLAQITDTIEVQPHQFKQELKAIQNAILIKYRDRILPSVGLCITLHSIVSLGDAFVFPGEGSAHYRVTFKLIAFKPFRGEIITGKVRACSEDGIYVSLGFFEDVFIPATELQVPSTFQTSEQLWVWTYESESEDGTVEVHKLWVERNDTIRFRVTGVYFNPPARQKRFKKLNNAQTSGQEGENSTSGAATDSTTPEDESEEREELSRMVVLGKISEDGLGMVSWWA